MLIELAISGRATDLVSTDNDLLSFRGSHSDAARRLRQRLPRLRVWLPEEFVGLLERK
jgi:predicted nucleic acid-binding protein